MTNQKKPVTFRAMMQRLNRALKKEYRVVRKSRNPLTEPGEFYCVDLNRNTVDSKGLDPEEWARELGVLAEYEEVVD